MCGGERIQKTPPLDGTVKVCPGRTCVSHERMFARLTTAIAGGSAADEPFDGVVPFGH
jgi:hypothetical protein